ncbi:two-component system, chemotaxis family, CheB/CheR fusion protein [Loktanella fryxellensis]|uniref:histidine kinase n=1 Tax=Loktanella fryxellensis TaxID=245187 RepID=A0A1H8CL53_9RHOB|nr:chemotaxis protein CheB [Loktanella fryxellensis]SEM95760.1 two-component system, chemotaxis family, CheB/CheR fusion protein [Loktanella fryxellensis]
MTDPIDPPSQLIIVGIGASAGGLEAIQGFLERLPGQQRMTFVIVQHLDPDHDSLMQELLDRRTDSPVVVATDGGPVEPGHIYLIAPGEMLTIVEDRFHTEKFAQPRGVRRPIDVFLTSLAQNSGVSAVGVILSGTGSDGSQGVRDIKNHGGLVLVQKPEEAKHDGMPRSAIATGACDLVVPVGEIVPVLEDFFDHIGNMTTGAMTDGELIQRVARHLRNRTGHDFSEYKPGTLLRRIAVRMSILGIATSQDYLRHLIDAPAEADLLFSSILINVTSFFRDADVFQTLRETVIPDLVTQVGAQATLRIWVAGCSTGEEAYSVAIVLHDTMERLNIWPSVSIFATDIDEDALRVARRGEYGNDIADQMPVSILQRHFRPRADGYVVNDTLRNMIRFSNQSLIKDPPFSQLDMVTCRNVLIYLEKPLQRAVISAFHYGLRENGLLVLGNSEAINNGKSLFTDVSRSARVFSRLPGPPARLDLRPSDRPVTRPTAQAADANIEPTHPYGADIMAHFAPPYMVLSDTSDLVYASTTATQFLQVKAGRPQTSVLKLIRPELESTLGRLLRLDYKMDTVQTILFDGDIGGQRRRLRIGGHVIADAQILVVFEEQTIDTTAPQHASNVADTDSHTYLRELEAELDMARARLRATMEDLETSNEELKSSNEEMMSMNEELQSANEELTTTNDELNTKIAEIRDANADMANLIESNKVSTIFLDADLRLRRFTPEARNQFRFVTADLGRPLDDIGSDLDVPTILKDCRAVIARREMVETEYQGRDGGTYRARIVPFEGDGNLGDGGVVLSLFDVTQLHQLAQEADAQRTLSEQRLTEIEDLYNVSPQAMGMLDRNLTYVRVNQRLADLAGLSMDELIGKPLGLLSPAMRDQMASLSRQVLDADARFENRQFQGAVRGDPDADRIWETDWYPVLHDEEVAGVGLNIRDVTERIQMQHELRRIMQELQHRVKNMLANVLALVSRASRDATVDRAVFVALSRRIQALAQTHKLLTQSNWASASLSQILEPELTSIYGTDRVELKGPEIVVNARAALSLGMAVHELATNAAKYGAFQQAGGKVRLSWVRQDDGERDLYIFRWTETGGPVPQDTGDNGFGTKLIRSTIVGSLDGTVEFLWEPSGLTCVMTIPVAALIEIPHDSIFNSAELQPSLR